MGPQITGYSAATALAGQTLMINGSGFSSNRAENLVRSGDTEAQVTAATPAQLTVRAPFGAETAAVSVRTPQGEGRGATPLRLRTSIRITWARTGSRPTPESQTATFARWLRWAERCWPERRTAASSGRLTAGRVGRRPTSG